MADVFADRLAQSYKQLSRSHADRVDVPEDRRFIGFDAYQKALDAGIDVVLLATPPGFRPIHFEAAVKAGKHVFMEKPVATDATGVRRVLATAAEAKTKNLKVGVGLQRHHEASYLETIKRLHDGAIGEIQSMRIYWNGGAVPLFRVFPRDTLHKQNAGLTEMEYQMRNWYNFVWTCGDHIVEQHVHNIDIAHWVMGGPPLRANGMGGQPARERRTTARSTIITSSNTNTPTARGFIASAGGSTTAGTTSRNTRWARRERRSCRTRSK